MSPAASPWILPPPRNGPSRRRLFCFAHAGGHAGLFASWRKALPDVDLCPVQLPGHGTRLSEALMRRATDIAAAAAQALAPYLDRPFAFFGHSLGALLAFETARALRRSGTSPGLLVVAGSRAPQTAPVRRRLLSSLPSEEFLREMQTRYDAIPPAVENEPELLELVLPILRADMEVVETYAYVDEPPLDCNLVSFGGDRDPHVAAGDLEAWRAQTRARFGRRLFPGGHFFVESARDAVLAALRLELAR